MAQAGFRAVVGVGLHTGNLIIGRVTIGKAIGHEHVKHVGIRESHPFAAFLLAVLEGVFYRLFSLSQREIQVHDSGLRTTGVHVNEQIIGRIESHQAVDGHTGVVCSDFGIAYALPINHELYRRYSTIQTCIPVGGFNAIHS